MKNIVLKALLHAKPNLFHVFKVLKGLLKVVMLTFQTTVILHIYWDTFRV